MKVAAIIQARRGSTRLPDKVLKIIEGRPMLFHVIDRVGHARSISQVYLATTTEGHDKVLARVAEESKVLTFFGSENDVLDRYYQAAKKFKIGHIARITSDCPLIDPQVIDMVVSRYGKGNFDYVSNVLRPTWPDGLDVELFSFTTLEKAWKEAKKPSDREHVTPYIWSNPAIFKIGFLENDVDLSGHRWTVDDMKDLKFVRRVYRYLYRKNPRFGYKDILSLIERHPEVRTINAGIKRNEGYKKSLGED